MRGLELQHIVSIYEISYNTHNTKAQFVTCTTGITVMKLRRQKSVGYKAAIGKRNKTAVGGIIC